MLDIVENMNSHRGISNSGLTKYLAKRFTSLLPDHQKREEYNEML